MRQQRNEESKPDQEPPRSLECEQAALGAMLMLHDEPVTKAVAALHPRIFTGSLRPMIFAAIAQLEQKRRGEAGRGEAAGYRAQSTLRSIDFISVFEELRRAGNAQTPDVTDGVPAAYLQVCIEACPCAANIDYYIGVVIEKSRLRHLRTLGERLQQVTAHSDADALRLHTAAQNALQAISVHGWCDLDAIFDNGK